MSRTGLHERGSEVIGDAVTEEFPEDESGRLEAVLPQRERRVEVLDLDLDDARGVGQGIETGQAHDLHWHDLRHEAACRWLARGLDLRAIQLLRDHADLKTTPRYLNVTDEELRKTMRQKLWNRREEVGYAAM
jgi:hypothetical protein